MNIRRCLLMVLLAAAAAPLPASPAEPGSAPEQPPVKLAAGSDLDALVRQQPPGASFLIAAGVHRRQRIVPKDGMTFTAEKGAVLDGENATKFAFLGGAAKVTIRGLEIRNYASPDYQAAVTCEDLKEKKKSKGWVLDQLFIHDNSSHGVNLGDDTTVTNCKVVGNGILGIGGRFFTGGLVEKNEVEGNNVRNPFPKSHGGGIKFGHAEGVVIRGNKVANNGIAGIWLDNASSRVTVEDNAVVNHHGYPGAGIMFEISSQAIIRNNRVSDCGRPKPEWAWGAGILISTSSDVQLVGNKVEKCDIGVSVVQQRRSSSEVKDIQVDNIAVRDNSIWDSGRDPNVLVGVVTDARDASLFRRRITFENNHYHGARPPVFWWNGRTLPLRQWQRVGFDRQDAYRPAPQK